MHVHSDGKSYMFAVDNVRNMSSKISSTPSSLLPVTVMDDNDMVRRDIKKPSSQQSPCKIMALILQTLCNVCSIFRGKKQYSQFLRTSRSYTYVCATTIVCLFCSINRQFFVPRVMCGKMTSATTKTIYLS
jgi:hypothetical protein